MGLQLSKLGIDRRNLLGGSAAALGIGALVGSPVLAQ